MKDLNDLYTLVKETNGFLIVIAWFLLCNLGKDDQ